MAEELGVLCIGPVQVNGVSRRLGSDIRERYSVLFFVVGPLKGYKLKLCIGSSVRPVAQNVRRIPFRLREKVDKKLDELLKLLLWYLRVTGHESLYRYVTRE